MLAPAPSCAPAPPPSKRAKTEACDAEPSPAEAALRALVAADGPVDLTANGGTRDALQAPTMGVITDPKCVARGTAAGSVVKGVVTLSAPGADDSPASTYDLVALVDVSGSMNDGDKLFSVKTAAKWVVKNARAGDRVCLISFDDNAHRLTGFVRCDEEGKKALLRVCDALLADGCTNIGAALDTALAAIKGLAERNPVTQIIVISDGYESCAQPLVAETSATLTSLAELATVSCVGVGKDHNASLMHRIAVRASGTFLFAETAVDVAPQIGALVGTVANAVAASLKVVVRVPGAPDVTHVVGAMVANETLCFPFEVRLTDDSPVAVAVDLTYTNVTNGVAVEDLGRSFAVDISDEGEGATLADAKLVDAHSNRTTVTAAIEQAMALVGSTQVPRDFEGARQLLVDAKDAVAASISAKEPISVGLVSDVEAILARIHAPQDFLSTGGVAFGLQFATAHSQQRFTGISSLEPMSSGVAYAPASIIRSVASASQYADNAV